MARLDTKKKELQCKIVYYGPGRSGKTTNLEYIHKRYRGEENGGIITIETHGDRTIFFDFLPIGIGKIKDHDVRVQIYTVPGQVMYNATRRVVLTGVDGIVFVADSIARRREKNILSLMDLEGNLAAHNKNISSIPLVIQYNKRDLEETQIPLLSVSTMEDDLNKKLSAPTFLSCATEGQNVINTLKTILTMTLTNLQLDIKWGA